MSYDRIDTVARETARLDEIARATPRFDIIADALPLSIVGLAKLFNPGDDGCNLDFTDKGVLYTDLALATPVTTDNDPIGSVEDQSGNGNNWAARNTSSRSTYTESGGLQYMTMASGGASNLRLISDITGFTSVDDITVVVAYSTHGSGGDRPLVLLSSSGFSGDILRVEPSLGGFFRDDSVGSISDTTTASDTSGDTFMVTLVKDGSEGRHYIDGSLVQTDTGLATYSADLSFASDFFGIDGDSNKIFYIFFINRALSSADLDEVHDFIKGKAGIS